MKATIVILAVSICVGLVHGVNAGIGSKVAGHGAKQVVKRAAKQAAKDAAGRVAKSVAEDVGKNFGSEAVGKLDDAARRLGREPGELRDLALNNQETFNKLLRTNDADALDFVVRNGEAGRFLFNRFYGQPYMRPGSKWLRPEGDETVREAYRIVDPKSASGSWKRLREKMTSAGINGPDRDLAEGLFVRQAQNGKVNFLSKDSKYFNGHVGDKRQGIDIVEIDPNGRPSIIEFGTGRKPDVGNPRQMTDNWIKEEWVKYIGDPNVKVNLRNAGINPRLLDPDYILRAEFNVADHFGKKIASPDIDLLKCVELGCEPIPLI